jgi:predicted small secreted protein
MKNIKTICLYFWLAAAVFVLTGCNNADIDAAAPRVENGNNRLIDYVKRQPAVKSIQEWNDIAESGLLITTNHYNIYTTMNDALMLRSLPGFVESLHREYLNKSGITSVSRNPKVIYLFQTREQWEQFGKTFTGDMWPVYQKIKKGAYYVNGACVTYNIGRSDTFGIIAHEGWHQFSHRHFKYRMPAWLDEGMAMQFEGFRSARGGYRFAPSYNTMRLQGLKRSFEQGQMPGLVSLLSENPAVVISGDQKDAPATINAYYSRMYALVRFLDQYGGGIYKPRLRSMMVSLVQGTWKVPDSVADMLDDRNNILTTKANSEIGIRLFTDYYGKDIAAIEEQFDRYCYSLVISQLPANKSR